jgi:predicted SAM-dependent methyltransferase
MTFYQLRKLSYKYNKVEFWNGYGQPVEHLCIQEPQLKLLNIGCGSVYHEAWINLDMAPVDARISKNDILKGIPYPDDYFDVVYHSHLLEHLDTLDVQFFLRECFRVTKPSGIHRVVVPDLERIARAYLTELDRAVVGDVAAEKRYDWIVLEIYDQAVRTSTGGKMLEYLNRKELEENDYIKQRIGHQAIDYWNDRREKGGISKKSSLSSRYLLAKGFMRFRTLLAERLVTLLLGNKGKIALRQGLFRVSGEIHQWMYDRFSLSRALLEAGFTDVRTCAADESCILGFTSYNLDTVNGVVRKPDSLFMEGAKL